MLRLPRLQVASGELLHLDVMRFVACCGIVYHHSHEFFFTGEQRLAAMDRATGLGLLVDLFFVISGFVIAYVYADKLGSVREIGAFLQRRIGRLLPLHLLTLVLSIALWTILAWVGIEARHTPSFNPQCITATVLLVHAMVPCEGVFFNYPSWSLSAEMAMYVMAPLLAVACFRWRRAVLAGSLILVVALAAALLAQGQVSAGAWGSLPPVVRAFPAFGFGMALYFCRDMVRRLPQPQLLLWLSTAGMFAAMLDGAAAWLVLCSVFAVSIFAVAADLQGRSSPLVTKLAPLGQLTYSVYMWHILFIIVLMNGLADKLLDAQGWAMAMIAAVCYALILACSYISFFAVETPARQWIGRLPLFK